MLLQNTGAKKNHSTNFASNPPSRCPKIVTALLRAWEFLHAHRTQAFLYTIETCFFLNSISSGVLHILHISSDCFTTYFSLEKKCLCPVSVNLIEVENLDFDVVRLDVTIPLMVKLV